MGYDTENWISGIDAEILQTVRKNEKPNKSEIQRAIGSTHSHVVKRVSKLEEKDLVTDKENGRQSDIELTLKGSEAVKGINQVKRSLEDDF